MATRVKRSALLPYAAEAVFDIVNDVSRYPEVLPWCSGAEVVEVNTDEVIASLSMRLRGLNETFTTRNILTPHERIDLELVSGPFKAFSGHWLFTRLGDAGCRVELNLEVQLSGIRLAFAGVVSRAADHLVDAFCARANTLLGSACAR